MMSIIASPRSFEHDEKAVKELGEKQFFELVVLSALLNLPPFMINQLREQKNSDDMYAKAKESGTKFYDF
jgi:hypothetical protein